VGVRIVNKEGIFALYKGLGAVVSGIVPKMAIRFSSFELYKGWMADSNGKVSTLATFVEIPPFSSSRSRRWHI